MACCGCYSGVVIVIRRSKSIHEGLWRGHSPFVARGELKFLRISDSFISYIVTLYYAMPKKYIVIGAGWFGIRAVQAIESISSDSEIIVLQVGTK